MAASSTRVESQHFLTGIIAVAALVRIGIFASTTLPALLERRPELTSPLTAFRSLKEGVYLYNNVLGPYSGGVFHHSPVYLFLFTHLVYVNSTILTSLLWTTVDIAASLCLVKIWRSRRISALPSWQGREYVVVLLYLFNPYTLLSCVARSTTSLDNFLVLAAIASACSGQRVLAVVSLAVASHTALYPVLLLPPLLLLLQKSSRPSLGARLSDSLVFALVYLAIAAVNTWALGPDWAYATLGVILTASDLTPNVGMWWYFFTEMFDHFRPFFRGVFQLHLLIYVAPLCLRLEDPLTVLLVLVGAISTWKSYPTVGDMALWAGLLGCFPEVVQNLRHPLFSLTTHLYTCILLPLLHSLWLLTGAGNANFFYAATMVYGLNSTLAIADVLGAILGNSVKKQLESLLFEPTSATEQPIEKEIDIVQLATLH